MQAPLVMFELEKERRLDRLVHEYGDFARDSLAQSVRRIEKRLGGARTRQALEALEAGDYRAVAQIALQYYDKGYAKSLGKRNAPVLTLRADEDDPLQTASELIKNKYICTK
jgi:tRNA 2-selenouridine synthase